MIHDVVLKSTLRLCKSHVSLKFLTCTLAAISILLQTSSFAGSLSEAIMSTIQSPHIILATRIHLGKQSTPPEQSKLKKSLSAFLRTASSIDAYRCVIAVDPAEKITGYDLIFFVKEALQEARRDAQQNLHCEILEVSPWGNFIPALNALTSWSCQHQVKYGNTVIMFISAETTLTKEAATEMIKHMSDDTLVVGAALPGHDYQGNGNKNGVEVRLDGRTCPWNTVAMWNLDKLPLLGFPLVAEGLYQLEDGSMVSGGIEEFSAILLQQKMNPNNSKAKLVKVPGVEWEQNFEDEERKKWHEAKMNSKASRAEVHRSVIGGGEGTVIHY